MAGARAGVVRSGEDTAEVQEPFGALLTGDVMSGPGRERMETGRCVRQGYECWEVRARSGRGGAVRNAADRAGVVVPVMGGDRRRRCVRTDDPAAEEAARRRRCPGCAPLAKRRMGTPPGLGCSSPSPSSRRPYSGRN
eukprot:1193152-Prorocentrum_minimum.AAC.4